MRITDEHIATFKAQGFVIIENFLSEEERVAALDGIYNLFSPPFEEYVAAGRQNTKPGQTTFPWDHSGLNHAIVHPDLIDGAERIIGSTEIVLGEAHLGIKYAGEEYAEGFHIDYGNNTLGPIQEPDEFQHIIYFYCFEDVLPGMGPIIMVPKGKPDSEAVPMLVPGGSVCIYTPVTRHSASSWQVDTGSRPAAWVSFNRADRPWDRPRGFTYKEGARYDAMARYIAEATPKQLQMLGFPAPGDPLWTEAFIEGMVTRYPGFDPGPYLV